MTKTVFCLLISVTCRAVDVVLPVPSAWTWSGNGVDRVAVFAPPLSRYFRWTLDDNASSTTVLDSGPSAVNGTMSSYTTAEKATSGVVGGALNFYSGEHFSVPSNAACLYDNATWTISAWMLRDGNNHSALYGAFNSNGVYSLYYYNKDYSCSVWIPDAVTQINYAYTYTPNIWLLLTLVKNGSTYAYYRNGELIASVDNTTGSPQTTVELWFGNYGDGMYYDGTTTLDDVRLYSVALSAAQVGELFLSYGYTPPPPPPPTYYLVLNTMGGSIDPASYVLIENQCYAAAYNYSSLIPYSEYYTFNGWELYYPGSGCWFSPYDTFYGGGDVTLYANWNTN